MALPEGSHARREQHLVGDPGGQVLVADRGDVDRGGREVERHVVVGTERGELRRFAVGEAFDSALDQQLLRAEGLGLVQRTLHDSSDCTPSRAARIDINPRRAWAFTVPSGMPVCAAISL
jgi:hypothetical protein